jgi:hypothetical protein
VKAALADYLLVQPKKSFANKVVRMADMGVRSTPGEDAGNLKPVVDNLCALGHYATCSFLSASEMKEVCSTFCVHAHLFCRRVSLHLGAYTRAYSMGLK